VLTRLVLSLAARNLLRHARRTALTASALGFGIGLMVLGRAWVAAMERGVVEPAKNGTLGHVEVFAKDAAFEEGGSVSFVMPQNNYRLIREPRTAIASILAGEPALKAGLSRLMVGALLSSGETSLEGILIGVDPRARAEVYPAVDLRQGRHFVPGENGVLLNRGVARKLGVGVGETLVALGNATDGRLTGVRLKVTGIWVVKGLEAYEWGACYTDLAAVQELLDVGDEAGVLVFRQKDPTEAAEPIVASLNRRFAAERAPLEAYSWEAMGGPFIGGVLVTRFVAGITDIVMALIVAAGVTNTALMSVFERTREIGTMRAIGSRRSLVLALFLLEALLLGLTGAVLGSGLGASLIIVLGRTGIPAFSEAQRYSYGGDFIYPVLNPRDLVVIPAAMVLVCVLAALLPALMASGKRPADALRYV
jgi:putative ABC transport system permease protein